MEFLFQIAGEILLQLLFEALCELGFYSLKDTVQSPRNPVLSTIGFFLWGAFAGAVSLWPLPHSFITNPDLRIFNLVLAPLTVAAAMSFVGKQREGWAKRC